MKNIFITGANGFIGQALCKRLMADGYQVRGAVRSAAQMTALPSKLILQPIIIKLSYPFLLEATVEYKSRTIKPRLNKSKIGFNWAGGVNTFDPQITQITQITHQ